MLVHLQKMQITDPLYSLLPDEMESDGSALRYVPGKARSHHLEMMLSKEELEEEQRSVKTTNMDATFLFQAHQPVREATGLFLISWCELVFCFSNPLRSTVNPPDAVFTCVCVSSAFSLEVYRRVYLPPFSARV